MENNFLTEASLGEFLNTYLPAGKWTSQYKLPNSRFKADFFSEPLKTCVEFDGYQHYTSSRQVLADARKDRLCNELGLEMVRIPYFVQLSAKTIKLLFGIDVPDFKQTFRHGFISDKATMVYPADFCHLGIQRFSADLEKFSCVKEEIIESLKTKKIDRLLLLPEPLLHLID